MFGSTPFLGSGICGDPGINLRALFNNCINPLIAEFIVLIKVLIGLTTRLSIKFRTVLKNPTIPLIKF